MFTDLLAHQEWADSLVWKAVTAASAFDDSVLAKLRHHITVQSAFLASWQGAPFDGSALQSAPPDALIAAARRYHDQARAFAAGLKPRALEQPHLVPWQAMVDQHLGRKANTPTLAETMTQVVMHSTYHRGQVNARLRHLGIEPPLTDFIAWVWFGKPGAEWPPGA